MILPMTYPRTWLTKRVRESIMLVLIIIFLLISPAIILYTAGYRYDIKQHRIKQTGVVSIDIEPVDARVYINDILIKKKIPIRLPNRAPGTYAVRIEREGYKTWHQVITVDSNQTTYIKDLTLFADTLPISIDTDIRIESVSFSPNGSHVLIVGHDDDIFTTYLYTVDNGEWTSIARSSIAPTFSWSPSSDIALIITDQTNGKKIERLDTINRSVTDIFALQQHELYVQWDSRESRAYTQEGNEIVSLGNVKTSLSLTTSSQWFIDTEKNLWYIDPVLNALKVADDESVSIPLTSEMLNARTLDVKKQFVLLQTMRGLVVINRETLETTLLPTMHTFYDTVLDRWIAWSDVEVWTIHQDGTVHLETRTRGGTIISVLPLHQYQSILLLTDKGISVVNPGYHTYLDLFLSEDITAITVNEKERSLLFHGTVGSKIGLFLLPLSHEQGRFSVNRD